MHRVKTTYIENSEISIPFAFSGLIPSYMQSICLFNLIAGNLSYLLIYVIACVKLKKYRLTPLAMLMPAYWVLLSIASWRGLIQLIKKPFYWDKTSHGVTKATKSTSWSNTSTSATSRDLTLQNESKQEASEADVWRGICSAGCYRAKTDKKKCKCKCQGKLHGKAHAKKQ